MTDVIRDLPTDERPRERLLRHGAGSLSNAELLALVLGCGTPGKNAIQLARELLKEGGWRGLNERDVANVSKTRGVGMAKATRIAAAFEMSRRLACETFPEEPEPPPYDLEEFGTNLVRTMGGHRQERLGAVVLDAHHRILDQREIFTGTIANALVSTRDLAEFAILTRASIGVVLYHNHPSGIAQPSEEDIEFTRKIKQSLWYFDLELVDHIIVGKHSFTSLKMRGVC
ncbi:MAG TPA: DNA repair protein RadC [Thermoanaerobaculia bacterium]